MTLRRYLVLTRRTFGVPVETQKTLVSERTVTGGHAQTRDTYAKIRQFFAEMGIGEEVMTIIMSTPNWEIDWLTRRELEATRLATHFINGEELVTGVPAWAAPPPRARCRRLRSHAVSGHLRDGRRVRERRGGGRPEVRSAGLPAQASARRRASSETVEKESRAGAAQ